MRSRRPGTAFGVSLALLIALCCFAAYARSSAQSGRRQTKPAPAAPVPTPTPEPTPTPAPKADKDETNFFVTTGHRGATVSRAPLSFHDAATNGCAEQLRKRTSLDVAVSLKEVSRGEAIEKAKSGQTTYVVMISVIEDYTTASSSGYFEFEVDYVVFAPVTAKVMASGRTYESTARKGPISVGRPKNVTLPSYREALLRKAGAEAADKILKSLHLNDPPRGKD